MLISIFMCCILSLVVVNATAPNTTAAHNITAIHHIPTDLRLDQMKFRPLRIVMSATGSHLAQFLNWYIFYHNACPNLPEIYFTCLDKECKMMLSKLGIPCAAEYDLRITKPYMRRTVWLLRTQVTKALLQEGYDVLLTDADSIWLRNPLTILSQFVSSGSDVIASRASYPTDIYDKVGATACMGFIYIRSSINTVSLWELLRSVMARGRKRDDQRDFNKLLDRLGLKFERRPTYANNTVEDTGVFTHNKTEMRLTLLPHSQFMRSCADHDPLTAVVAHCRGTGNTTYEFTLQSHGMWALNAQWNSTLSKAASVTGNDSSVLTKISILVHSISNRNVTDSLRMHDS